MERIWYKAVQNTIGKIKYKHLLLFKRYGLDLIYYKVLQFVFKMDSFLIGRRRDKIKVTFLVYIDNTWSGEYLYRYLEKDDRFDVKIAIMKLPGRTDEYVRTKNYFAPSHKTVTISTESELIDTDILIYTTISNRRITAANQREYSILTLGIMMPYSFWLDEYSDRLFEEEVSLCFWKFYCPSAIHKLIGRKKCDVGGLNMIYSGYPKMDCFYNSSAIIVRKMLWKGENGKRKIRIIYAPGMFSADSRANFSTFMDNAVWILEYARCHMETTSWIYRPHPYLARSLEMEGGMKREEYEAYEKEWRELPNANVICGGDYYDIFITSDGMILDSISFVSGYQYTGKPLLYLEKESPKFNAYGVKIMQILYRAKGNDLEKIQSFIERTVGEKQDYMYEKRRRFFRKYLDYRAFHQGALASEYIFKDIKRSLGK